MIVWVQMCVGMGVWMSVCGVQTHQKDQVSLLIQGSGDTDPLFLPTWQDNPLCEKAENTWQALFCEGLLQQGMNTVTCLNAHGTHPESGERDQSLFPALLVHEEMQHDSARFEQGHPRSPHTKRYILAVQ